MSCPATSYCPLYEATPLQSWQMLPCARDFCGYYTTEDDILEEFLCVAIDSYLMPLIAIIIARGIT
jgi:hypothetical protein